MNMDLIWLSMLITMMINSVTYGQYDDNSLEIKLTVPTFDSTSIIIESTQESSLSPATITMKATPLSTLLLSPNDREMLRRLILIKTLEHQDGQVNIDADYDRLRKWKKMLLHEHWNRYSYIKHIIRLKFDCNLMAQRLLQIDKKLSNSKSSCEQLLKKFLSLSAIFRMKKCTDNSVNGECLKIQHIIHEYLHSTGYECFVHNVYVNCNDAPQYRKLFEKEYKLQQCDNILYMDSQVCKMINILTIQIRFKIQNECKQKKKFLIILERKIHFIKID